MNWPPSCRLCESKTLTPLEEHQPTASVLYHCGSCDGQFWWPALNPGATWYEDTYAGRNEDPAQTVGWNHTQFLNEPISPKTLLDVGAGIGHLMAAARGRGWDVYGLDFDERGIQAAREYFGITTIEPMSMDDFVRANPGKKFFAVTAFEVLEHMDDPVLFISQMRDLVEPGGYVAFSVPYRNTPLWLRRHDFPPRHLTRWNRKAMQNFLIRNGFVVTHLRRGAITLPLLLMRIRFRAGPLGHLGLVSKAKTKFATGGMSAVAQGQWVAWLRRAARLKDWVLFGLPTVTLWLYLWARRRHYITLYALAKKPV